MGGKPNLRQQQRIATRLEVIVSDREGNTLTCHTANLSRAGMMVECESERLDTLIADKRNIAPKDPVELDVRFSIPVVTVQSVTVEARCYVVHIRRVSRRMYHLGLQFSQFEGNGHDYVDQFVARELNQ
ncbi:MULTISPECIES: PilZ domain-containing protein [Marinobacter]|uniref:PilZ domain-containing protein n=1 Tax=Marinobacter TaxID=2742 RepID=UPI001D17B252|nr:MULTISPECIES: PilZ domain-containing protein [Marinobacter]